MRKQKITPEMKLIASLIGGIRSLNARNCGVKDAKIGPQSGFDADQDGFLGELAFCKMMNLCPDFGLNPRSGSADAVLSKDGVIFRIDVKTTRRINGRLCATLKHNPDVDIYVLAIIDEENQEILFPGFAFTKDLCQEENIINLGHGKGYALQQNKLRGWK